MLFFFKYSAEHNSPEKINQLVSCFPRVQTINVPPKQGNRPSLISGKPNWQFLSAKIKSHAKANSNPPPKANLLTQAIRGFLKLSKVFQNKSYS